MFMRYCIYFLFCIFLFTGCIFNNQQQTVSLKTIDNIEIQSASLQKTLQEKAAKFQARSSIDKKLYAFYNDWKGVKYKLGGNSKRGIDCSAFIQKAFKEKLNLNLPRTTTLQSKVGKTINKSQLNSGDLVFFKTGRNSRHVGIYMEKGNFMHASTKRGVTISRLDNLYFKKHYWKATRVIH